MQLSDVANMVFSSAQVITQTPLIQTYFQKNMCPCVCVCVCGEPNRENKEVSTLQLCLIDEDTNTF